MSFSLPLSPSLLYGGIMMRRTFKSDFGTLVPLLASQCRHPLLLLATNTIDAAGSPDCLGPGFHCLSRLCSGVYVQEVTFCFWLSCAFFFVFFPFLFLSLLRSSHSVPSYDVHCAISSLDYCCCCCCCCCCRRRRRRAPALSRQ